MAAVSARYTPGSSSGYSRSRSASPRPVYPEEDSALSSSARRVWYALAHRGALASWLDFSPTWLAPEIEMSRSSMFAALRELTMTGYIERSRRGRLTSAHCVTPLRGRS